MERYTKSELENFNKSFDKIGDCYLWNKYLDKDGYGTFYFRHKGRRAHRVSFYMFVGDIQEGLVIDHICGKKNCVNPAHLRMITVKENNLDSRNVSGINSRKTHCKNGHPFDRFYCNQRSCSICTAESHKKGRVKLLEKANQIKC